MRDLRQAADLALPELPQMRQDGQVGVIASQMHPLNGQGPVSQAG
jgi:hypothetical protein